MRFIKTIVFLLCFSVLLFNGCGANSAPEEEKLWRGITSGNLELVKEAVNDGADINIFTDKKHGVNGIYGEKIYNPTVISILRGERKIAEYLIDSGADVNCVVDKQGRTILQYVLPFSLQVSEKMILYGADLKHIDKNGLDVFDSAIKCVDFKTGDLAYYLLVEHDAKPTENNLKNAIDDIGIENYGIIRHMLQNGVPNSGIDSCLKSAFLGNFVGCNNSASHECDIELVSNIVSAFGHTEDLIEIVGNKNFTSDMLLAAVIYRNKDVVDFLIDKSVQVDSRYLSDAIVKSDSAEIYDLLYHAHYELQMDRIVVGCIDANSIELLKHLVDSGLNIESSLRSPLAFASGQGNFDVVELLIKCGANVDAAHNFSTPLIEACVDGHYDIAKILIENGANVNCSNPQSSVLYEETPLTAAISAGDYETVCLLLENGANPLYVLSDGSNALELANFYEAKRIIEAIDNYIDRTL